MLTKEQMDTMIGRLKVYGSESGRGKDHPNAITCRTAASVIIEQQAEIERLRGELKAALAYFDHHGITGGSVDSTRALLLGATQCTPTTTQTNAQVWILTKGMCPHRGSCSGASWHRAQCL